MLLLPFDEIIASPTFEFLVGAEKKSFIVHESVVACISQPLKAMMTGSMAEAKDKRATLPDVEPQTFVHFASYIYTGHYFVPVLKNVEEYTENESANETTTETTKGTESKSETPTQAPAIIPEPLEDLIDDTKPTTQTHAPSTTKAQNQNTPSLFGFGNAVVQSQSKAASIVRLELAKTFVNADADTSDVIDERLQVQKIPRNTDERQEMCDIYLAHARLYVFCDMYDIKELAQVALYKIRSCLSALKLFPSRVKDLVALIRYSYANTVEDDALRKLMVDFSVCMAEHLMVHPDFKALTKEDGSFSTDLLSKVMARLA